MKMINDIKAWAMTCLRGLSRAAVAPGMRVEPRRAGSRFRALPRRGERGQAILEIAFFLPFLLMVLTGILWFGFAINNQLELTSGVQIGAQFLANSRTSTTNPCADTLTAIVNASPVLVKSNITLTLTMNGTAVPGQSCAGDQTMLVSGSTVTVAATYPCTLPVYGTKFASCKLGASQSEYEY
jgi:Flp pilus assembly protein TadG